jgi:hypothetical protein
MGYLGPEPQLADAYRVLGRQVRAVDAETRYATTRRRELLAALTGPVVKPFKVDPGSWCPEHYMGDHAIRLDMALWILETSDEPAVEIARLVMCDEGITRELIERYVDAKVADEIARRDWLAEADEIVAWQRAGGF